MSWCKVWILEEVAYEKNTTQTDPQNWPVSAGQNIIVMKMTEYFYTNCVNHEDFINKYSKDFY